MAWRFAPSKYKNTTPKIPKKEDTVFDLPIGTLSCTNNGIEASANHIAFCIEGEGGKLGVVPVGTKGRRLRKDITVVCAHAEQVDDFSFLPFDDDLLVTCSRDEKAKLWRIGAEGEDPSLDADVDLGSGVLLGSLSAHTTCSGIVAFTSTDSAIVVDWEKKQVAYELSGMVDKGLSCTWSEDGRLLAANCDKGRMGIIWDPRSGSSPIQTLDLHSGMGREGRILFAGNRLVSSGFTNKRVQEVRVFDNGSWDKSVHQEEFTATTGLLIPLYDPDTKLLYLAGKGTNKLVMTEMQKDRSPILSRVFELTLPEQLLGACLGSKRSVKVMEGEVQTFYELTKSSILPLPCIVPRRSYRDFHADLFPDTRGNVAACTAEEWRSGTDKMPAKISLAPGGSPVHAAVSAVPPEPAVIPPSKIESMPRPASISKPVTNGNGADLIIPSNNERPVAEVKPTQKITIPVDSREQSPASEKENIAMDKKADGDQKPVVRIRQAVADTVISEKRPMSSANRIRPKSCVVGQVASKFRHVEVLAGIKANNSVFSNLRNVNTRLSPEANGVCVSNIFAAVPLSGPAGIVCILDVDEPCKLPDGVMDGIFNKAQVTDLQWNPFDERELACGTDVGLINIWRLSKEDGPRNDMEPFRAIKVGGEKIVCLRWHPLARDLVAVALSDATVELWNVKEGKRYVQIPAHDTAILGIAWSADGKKLATVGKDLMLRVFVPQLGSNCLLLEAKCLESPRSARVLFACDDRMIIVIGFTRSSTRQIQLYDAASLRLLHTQHMDNAVQPLVPHYDFDTSVLFLTGKGDRTVQMFEICFDSPYLLPLSPFTCVAGHQAVAFHNKTKCNVMSVEFQRGWRLTEKSFEGLIFKVPRVKKDVFQSDLFPDALVTWEPVCSASEWIAGCETTPNFASLRPAGVSATAVDTSPTSAPRLARMSQFMGGASSAAVASGKSGADTPPTNDAQKPSQPEVEKESKTSKKIEPVPTPTENVQKPCESVVSKEQELAREAVISAALDRDAIPEIKYPELPPLTDTAMSKAAPLAEMDDDEIKKEVETSWSDKINVDKHLEQDRMEGVAEEEWMDE